ncbi:AB hydrolase-1 domain-containing protein [Citrus sinensis]|nr:AB hydrolase-1 domain-containing protein [Citrus sinensis]
MTVGTTSFSCYACKITTELHRYAGPLHYAQNVNTPQTCSPLIFLKRLSRHTHENKNIPDMTAGNATKIAPGNPLKMVMDNVVKGLSPQPTIEQLSQDLVTVSSYLPVLADILQKETLLWKLELLKAASAYANARLHAVKAQTLVLSGGKDQLLPSQEEGQRLTSALPKSQLRSFEDHGHFLFLEDGVDLVTIIKGASYYRRGKSLDYISDFMPPTATEFNELNEENRWMSVLMSPVMLSTLEDGKIVRGLSGIPSEGPVLLVGYHNLMGFEVYTMVPQFLIERKILLRGLTHPILFVDSKDGGLPDLGPYDKFRIMGAVPVSAVNFYKLMSSKSHALLYPGGMREAMHRKGEEYKLFWPETSEFVRMAATFGATIIPFGTVGEDDVAQIVLDVDDQMKIPFMKSQIEEWTKQYIKVSGASTEQRAIAWLLVQWRLGSVAASGEPEGLARWLINIDDESDRLDS